MEPLHSNSNYKVVVGPSSVHGRGVFTTMETKAGDILTVYPEHARKLPDGVIIISDTNPKIVISEEVWQDYAINIGDDTKIVAHPDITDHGVGHLVNDAVGPEDIMVYLILQQMDHDAITNEIVEKGQHNAKFTLDPQTKQVHVVATRAIAANEEVLVYYGLKYWLSWILRNNHLKR